MAEETMQVVETQIEDNFREPENEASLLAEETAAVASPSFAPLTEYDGTGAATGIDILLDVAVEISVELGRTQMSIGEVMALRSSSVIELDKLAGEPADILVNGTKVARGEVVVVDEKFGVRVLEVESRAKRLTSLDA